MDLFESPPATPVRETLDESSLTLQLGKYRGRKQDRVSIPSSATVGAVRTRRSISGKGYFEASEARPPSFSFASDEETEEKQDRVSRAASSVVGMARTRRNSIEASARTGYLEIAETTGSSVENDEGAGTRKASGYNSLQGFDHPNEHHKVGNGGISSEISHIFGSNDYSSTAERGFWFGQEMANAEASTERKKDSREDVEEISISFDERLGKDSRTIVGYDPYGHQFFAGDFVWGRVKTNLWWPGQVYDTSDASDLAERFKHKDCLLVTYFGADSFMWCHPSMLEPFEENFTSRSKQNTSRKFINALQDALAVISKLLELRMTCPCIRNEDEVDLSPPFTKNSGIKEGVVVPVCVVDSIITAHYEPVMLMKSLSAMAKASSPENMLDFAVMQCWLSVFYKAKGVSSLATFHEPQPIPEPEYVEGDGSEDTSSFYDFPDEDKSGDDWLSSLVGPICGIPNEAYLPTHIGIAEGKLPLRRKQESMTEIMFDDTNKEAKDADDDDDDALNKGNTSEEPYPYGERNEETVLEEHIITKKRGRKRKNERSDGETTNIQVKIDDDVENRKDFPSRERKKSKYLSPPYTENLGDDVGKSSSKDHENVLPKASDGARIGERISRVAGQLVGHPTVRKCGNATGTQQNNFFEELAFAEESNLFDLNDVKVDPKEAIAELYDVAAGAASLDCNHSSVSSRKFIFIFRCSVYHDGFNGKTLVGHQSMDENLKCTSDSSSEARVSCLPSRKKEPQFVETAERRIEPNMRVDMSISGEQIVSDVKTNVNKFTELFVQFPPTASLPTKDDLIQIYRRFGALSESETDILPNSFCCRVTFLRTDDAEKAFNSSVEGFPFGPEKVNFRLRYPPELPTLNEPIVNYPSPHEEGNSKAFENLPADNLVENECSEIDVIRQKLGLMSSMIDKCEGKLSLEFMQKLAVEVRSLLEYLPPVD